MPGRTCQATARLWPPSHRGHADTLYDEGLADGAWRAAVKAAHGRESEPARARRDAFPARATADVAALARLASLIASADSTDERLDHLLHEAIRAVGATRGCLWLFDPAEHAYVIARHTGLRPETVGQFKIRHGEGVAGRVIAERRPMVAYAGDPLLSHQFAVAENIRHMAAAPMVLGDEVLGAICLFDRDTPHFSQSDLPYVSAIAEIAAGVIVLQRLQDGKRRQAEDQQAQLDLARALAASLDRKEIVANVIATMRRLAPEYETAAIVVERSAEPPALRDALARRRTLTVTGAEAVRTLLEAARSSFVTPPPDAPYASLILLPMHAGSTVHGALVLVSTRVELEPD